MAPAISGSLRQSVVLASLAVTLASRALAAPAAPWLDWHGPIECQNTREVERQIESLLGHAPDLTQMPPTRVDLAWAAARGWTLRIGVALPGGERRREVDVRTCADGFDVVALTLALILDPDLELGEPLAPPPAAPSLADVDAAEDPAADGRDTEAEVGAVAPIAHAVAVEAAPAPAELDDSPGSPAMSASGHAPALTLAAGGRADLGSLPATLFGGELELSLAAWNWRLSAGAVFLGRGGETLPTARYPVSYSNLFGLARVCREFPGVGGGHFGTCAGAELGSLGVSEVGGEERSARGIWASANLGVELGLDLTSSWGAYTRMDLVFPLVRHELTLQGAGVVHELPVISVQFAVGATLQLTEWAEQ
jgi:hypothetical protein